LSHGHSIESITVVDYSGAECDTSFYTLEDVQLDVQAYDLHESNNDASQRSQSVQIDGNDEDYTLQVRVTNLPSKSLVGAWDS